VKPTIRSTDLAHLAHVELLSPRPDDSLRFFVDVLGMTESGRRGDSVYLRAWDDYEHHTLNLTASKVAHMGHVAFRATSPEALERPAAIIDAAGFGSNLGSSRSQRGSRARERRSQALTRTVSDAPTCFGRRP